MQAKRKFTNVWIALLIFVAIILVVIIWATKAVTFRNDVAEQEQIEVIEAVDINTADTLVIVKED